MGAGERHQHQAYQGGKQQLRGERRIKLALPLPAAHRLQHLMILLIAKTRVHMLAQHRHLADDLLHPQRREPRVFLRHGRQGFNEQRKGGDRIVAVRDKNLSDLAA